jgi:hypothetical protein|tara:strand:- start:89 stop:196 length:108 start_codon:yes stop_codon:yes gene_type:complete
MRVEPPEYEIGLASRPNDARPIINITLIPIGGILA